MKETRDPCAAAPKLAWTAPRLTVMRAKEAENGPGAIPDELYGS